MSREQVTIGAVVDIGGSVKSLRDLKGDIESAKDKLNELNSDSKDYKDTLELLTQAQEEYSGVLEATINLQKNTTSAIEGMTNVTDGMMGGFQALNGVLALTGTENKNLVETLVKLKAVSSVVQGFKQFTEAIKAGNIAFKLFNITVKSNPLMLLATTIITVIALVREFTSSLDEANDSSERLEDISARSREQSREMDLGLKELNKSIKNRIDLAKEEGKTEEEINKIKLEGRKEVLDYYDKNSVKLKDNLEYDLLNIARHNTDRIKLYDEYYKKLGQAEEYYNKRIEKQQENLEKAKTDGAKASYKSEISRLKEGLDNVRKYFKEANKKGLESIEFYKNGVKDLELFNDRVGRQIIRNLGSDFSAALTLRENYNKDIIDNEKAKNKQIEDFVIEDRLTTAKEDRLAREQQEEEERKALERQLKEKERMSENERAIHNTKIERAIAKEDELINVKLANDRAYDKITEDVYINSMNSAKDYYDYLESKYTQSSDYIEVLVDQLNRSDLYVDDDLIQSDPNEANARYNKRLELTAEIGEKLIENKSIEMELFNLDKDRLNTEKESILTLSELEANRIKAKEEARQAGLDYQDIDTKLEIFEQEKTLNEAKAEMFLELANDESLSWEIRAEAIQSYDGYLQKSLKAFVDAEKTKKQLTERRKQIEKSAFNSTKAITYNTMDIINENIGNSKAGAIAKTTIDTYASATEAYRSQLPLGPKGPILGGLAAAAAITAGLKNVKAIMKTKTPGNKGGGSGGGGNISQPDYLDNNPQITEQFVKMTSDDLDEINNSNKRVYVVESDITNTQNRVRTTENQATF